MPQPLSAAIGLASPGDLAQRHRPQVLALPGQHADEQRRLFAVGGTVSDQPATCRRCRHSVPERAARGRHGEDTLSEPLSTPRSALKCLSLTLLVTRARAETPLSCLQRQTP